MPQTQNSLLSLKQALTVAPYRRGMLHCAQGARVSWDDLAAGSVLGESDLRGKSVLLAMRHQHTVAALLVELDGVACRIVLYPPDLSLEHLDYVARTATVDAIVCDRNMGEFEQPEAEWMIPLDTLRPAVHVNHDADLETEWVLLTSGTTGRPKLVVHTFDSLAQATTDEPSPAGDVVWSTFYDIRRYGGLQIFLRAALAGSSLVLSAAAETVPDFLVRAGTLGVTHISGTPTHWRRAAMSAAAGLISPRYVRLSGEIADQAILSHLASLYPKAAVAHAFATTEAGVVFAVNDGLMGLPVDCFANSPQIRMKIENGSLRVRSDRTARCYLGDGVPALKDSDGFVNTGDVLEQRQGRYYFAGRGDGVINVGGKKVHPEEVEAVINGHPKVRMSLVRMKKSALVGSIVVADVVLNAAAATAAIESGDLHRDILNFCRGALDSYKVPAAVNFVPALPIAESGKLIRRHV